MEPTAPAASPRRLEPHAAPRRDGPRLNRRRSGFTMIELLVAITVLLVSLAAAVGGQVASFGLIGSSRDATLAMAELERCMEEVLTKSSDNIPVDFPEGASIPGYEGGALNEQVIVPTYPDYGGSGPIPDPLDVVLEARWLDARGRLQRLTLTTTVAR